MRFIPQCSHGYSRLPPQLRGKLLIFIKIKISATEKPSVRFLTIKKSIWRKKVMLSETQCPLKRRAISFAQRHVSGCYIASFMHEVL